MPAFSSLIVCSTENGTDLDLIQNTFQGSADPESRVVDRLTGKQLYAAFADLNEKQRITLDMGAARSFRNCVLCRPQVHCPQRHTSRHSAPRRCHSKL